MDQFAEILHLHSDPSDALWFLQQMSDEVKQALAGMILNEQWA